MTARGNSAEQPLRFDAPLGRPRPGRRHHQDVGAGEFGAEVGTPAR